MNGLIVGGGIGGLTAAISLSRAGHRVTLVERMERFEPVGAGIGMAPNAVRALASLDIDLSKHGFALKSFDILRADGTRLQQLEPQHISSDWGPIWALARSDLHALLLAQMPSNVELIQGVTVGDVREVADGVEVDLKGTRRFDFVVGADGLHSKIRDGALGPQKIRYSGTTCWRGIASNPGSESAVEIWGGRGRVGLVPLPKSQLYYYLVMSAPRRAAPLEWPSGFREVFGHCRGGAEKLFDVLTTVPPLHHDLEELEAPVWGRGRIFLLGDAAHAMTPNQGQGAAMAIEDALALTQSLAPGLEGALNQYTQMRHQRVRKVQLESRRIGEVAHWENSAARAARDALIRMIPPGLSRLQYRNMVEPGFALVDGRGMKSARQKRWIAVASASVLSLLSLLHLVWTSSPWPFASREDFSRAVIGSVDSERAPSLQAGVAVALLLAISAWILLARTKCVSTGVPTWILRTGSWAIAGVFILRAVLGFFISATSDLMTHELMSGIALCIPHFAWR